MQPLLVSTDLWENVNYIIHEIYICSQVLYICTPTGLKNYTPIYSTELCDMYM